MPTKSQSLEENTAKKREMKGNFNSKNGRKTKGYTPSTNAWRNQYLKIIAIL